MKQYLKLLHIKHLKVQKPTNYPTIQNYRQTSSSCITQTSFSPYPRISASQSVRISFLILFIIFVFCVSFPFGGGQVDTVRWENITSCRNNPMDVPVQSTLHPTISRVATEHQNYDAQTKASSTHELTFKASPRNRHLFRESE